MSSICSVESCERPVNTGDLCSGHHKRFLRGTPLDLPWFVPAKGCSVDGCDRPHKGFGFCQLHLNRFKKGTLLDAPIQIREKLNGALCSVEGCPTKAINATSGSPLCWKHHNRWKSTGSPIETRITPKGEGLIWLQSVIDEEPDGLCRLWPFPLKEGVRPTIWFDDRKSVYAYHVVLELTGCPRPGSEYLVRHSCDNGTCCAPWHLCWGTCQENNDDMMDRGRHYTQKHEKLLAWLDEHSINFPEEMR